MSISSLTRKTMATLETLDLTTMDLTTMDRQEDVPAILPMQTPDNVYENRPPQPVQISRTHAFLRNHPDLLTAVNNFVEGNFDYVEWYDKPTYITAWQAITQTESWDFMRNFNGNSFMFSRDNNVARISSKIEELGYGGHSGGSFGDIMRIMEYIAVRGERHFMMEYIEDRATRYYRQTG